MSRDGEYFVGVDQGGRHQVVVMGADGEVVGQRGVPHSAETILELVDWVGELCGDDFEGVLVGAESPHGAVMSAFLVAAAKGYSINPKQLDRFRDRYSSAGAKDDSRDAFVLADALRTDRHCFSRVSLDPAIVVSLRETGRLRDRLVRHRGRLTNQLQSRLHEVWPQLLDLSPGADERWLWSLLERAPHPERARRLQSTTLRKLLASHRIRRLTAAELREQLRKPRMPLPEASFETAAYEIEVLVAQLKLLDRQLKATEKRLARQLQQATDDEEGDQGEGGGPHPSDAAIIRSWPGIGVIVASTLIGEAHHLLRDYQRLRCVAGVAPVTRQSGSSRIVIRRYSYNRRIQHAVRFWALNATQSEPRLRRRYEELRGRGHSHSRALRQLGDGLLRGLSASLRNRSLYSKPDSNENHDEQPIAA